MTSFRNFVIEDLNVSSAWYVTFLCVCIYIYILIFFSKQVRMLLLLELGVLWGSLFFIWESDSRTEEVCICM